jgi:hypothetical protein
MFPFHPVAHRTATHWPGLVYYAHRAAFVQVGIDETAIESIEGTARPMGIGVVAEASTDLD